MFLFLCFVLCFVFYLSLAVQQAQRRAAMDRYMHCIIPNESYKYNINHNIIIRHCSFKYALHIHDGIYEGAFLINSIMLNLPKTKKFGCVGRGDLTSLFFSKVVKY